jgi:hypothetical protein
VGLGGVGKTRLALRAARELVPSFPGGVFRVDLEGAVAVPQVFVRVADVLGVRDGDAARVGQGLAARGPVLLVLDNFEAVNDAAPQVADWVAAAPELSVLITSRRALHVSGERLISVSRWVGPTPRPCSVRAPSSRRTPTRSWCRRWSPCSTATHGPSTSLQDAPGASRCPPCWGAPRSDCAPSSAGSPSFAEPGAPGSSGGAPRPRRRYRPTPAHPGRRRQAPPPPRCTAATSSPAAKPSDLPRPAARLAPSTRSTPG